MLKRLATVCVRSTGHSQKRFRGKSTSKPKHRPKWSQSPRPFGALPSDEAPHGQSRSPFTSPSLSQCMATAPPDHLTPETASKYFEAHVVQWSQDPRTLARYQNFGFSTSDMRVVLAAFAEASTSGFFSTPENQSKYQLARFATKPSTSTPKWAPLSRQFEAEITFSNVFFSWCRHPADSTVLDNLVEDQAITLEFLESLRHVAEIAFRRPAEEFPFTRRMQRKVIMHVGPTNSGKTHHALRALAAAKTGVYAGPLRLLAHEVWERLNLGQIVPLGVEQPPPNFNGHPSSAPPSPSVAQSLALYTRPKETLPTTASAYSRATNMLTGEEKKIVDPNAGLLSCTVEMLSFRMEYDVGVIDEIQMIGDSERGFAWTSAVLGLSAKELHLCGEASAVPIVKALLSETGDDFEVREYERLTPLHVEEKSLGGDYSNIQKGDCVVAFSRNRIFAIKGEIEKKSGLKCAVVYGKLPPEIRSEQAALFNDPNSGFDVIIGSDAIGMGLNLKIRRIIFDSVTKGDGSAKHQIPLSLSQTKQIAGRAGRYGHSIDSSSPPGGYVTTLHEKDLPFIKDAVSHPTTPVIQHAYVGPTIESMEAFCSALPIVATSTPAYDPSSPSSPNTSLLESIQMAHLYLSSLPLSYKYINSTNPGSLKKLSRTCEWVEKHSKGVLTWAEKICWMLSPVSWRDDLCLRCFEIVIRRQREDMDVGDIKAVLEETSLVLFGSSVGRGLVGEGRMEMPKGFVQVLEWVEEQMKMYLKAQEALENLKREKEGSAVEGVEDGALSSSSAAENPVTAVKHRTFIPEITEDTLSLLESFHKILVFYMWMLFRNSVVFSDQQTTEELKRRVEVALDWALQVISYSQKDTGDKAKKGKGKARGAKVTGREELFGERASIRQLVADFEKRNAEEGVRMRGNGKIGKMSVWSDTEKKGEEEGGGKKRDIGILDNLELKAKNKRAWVQAPDMTTLLKSYVENPGLSVGRRSGAYTAVPMDTVMGGMKLKGRTKS